MLPASRQPLPAVLSIAGSDPSGGAGVQADLKTFAAFGVYGGAVITALTAQNAQTVSGVLPVPEAFVALELATAFADMNYSAIKIGMLGTGAVIGAVAASLREFAKDNIVIDPVLRSSSGADLLDDDGLDALSTELFPLARLITPNAEEAGALLGRAAPRTLAEMHIAARDLRAFGLPWVLITGGHVDLGEECVDVLHGTGEMIEIRAPRLGGPARHGTGCTLSSAIAALLALGREVPEACEEAQAYVGAAMAAAGALVVTGETKPLYHVPSTFAPAGRVQ